MSNMNIPYRIDNEPDMPLCKLASIWKVQANAAYQVNKRIGFEASGLFITYEGQGMFEQAGVRCKLQAGTYFLVPDAAAAVYGCLEDNWKFYYIDLNSLDMCRALQLQAGVAITTGKVAEAIHLCEQMIDCLIAQPIGYIYSANHLLQDILLLFARERSVTDAASLRHTEINSLLIYMHKNIDKPLRVDELAHQSGMSRTSFYTRFRSVTGQSPNDYMLKLKLESAKISLETTSLSVKEIGTRLHFYDEFHFSKLFKRRFGISPGAYRRSRNDGEQQREKE